MPTSSATRATRSVHRARTERGSVCPGPVARASVVQERARSLRDDATRVRAPAGIAPRPADAAVELQRHHQALPRRRRQPATSTSPSARHGARHRRRERRRQVDPDEDPLRHAAARTRAPSRSTARRSASHSPGDAIDAGIGMVHQHFMLADNLTVLENVVLGSEPRKGGIARLRRARGGGSRRSPTATASTSSRTRWSRTSASATGSGSRSSRSSTAARGS